MKLIILHTFLFLLVLSSDAQEINYNQHIAPIIKTHCERCHHPSGIAPFSLQTYNEVASRGGFVEYVTSTRYMPPFKADNSFQHYKNENLLTDVEIEKIKKWVAAGKPEGKKVKLSRPVETDEHQLEMIVSIPGRSDLQLGMRNAFKIPEMQKEEFRYFHLPLQNKEEKFIQTIRFIPGNKKLVHHSRLMIDTTGSIAGINGISESDTTVYQYQTKPLADPFLFGWVPGNDEISFPRGTGKRLYAGSDFILNMHYAPTPIAASDSSSIQITYTDAPVTREVITLTLKEDQISNLPFVIQANKTPTFYMRTAPLEEDVSFISIMPHMHLLGKRFKAFAITPQGEVIPLVNIPDWDFNWQMTYVFKKFLKVPKGSVIYAEGQYDNTRNNPRNPNNPPIDVTYGWGTKDEMMNLVIYYVKYQEGDENTPL